MLFRFGTAADLAHLPELPMSVLTCIEQNVNIFDQEYGAERDLDRDDGGYCLLAETAYDVHLMAAAVDYNIHPCEWIDLLADGVFCSAMFLLSNDFAIVCVMPVAYLPKPLAAEL